MSTVTSLGVLPRLSIDLERRLFNVRNRILSDVRFQRWASRFPLTRGVARRRARSVFDLCAGFVYSQIVYAVVELGVLEALRGGARTADDLAVELGIPEASASRLLDAATSLKLVQRHHGSYGLGIHGAAMVGNDSVLALVKHHALLYRDLSDPVQLLRATRPETETQRFWTYAANDPRTQAEKDVGPYSDLMAASLCLIAEDILDAYDVRAHRRLLDVGGGSGAFLTAAASVAPDLALVLFDLPGVADLGRAQLAREGLGPRSTVVGGDVFRTPLPKGADLISLVRVIHDHDDAAALHILQRAHDALQPGGCVLLAEPMADTLCSVAASHAYFGFYLLALGQGRARTLEQLSGLLARAGFERVSERPTGRPMLTRVVVGRRS